MINKSSYPLDFLWPRWTNLVSHGITLHHDEQDRSLIGYLLVLMNKADLCLDICWSWRTKKTALSLDISWSWWTDLVLEISWSWSTKSGLSLDFSWSLWTKLVSHWIYLIMNNKTGLSSGSCCFLARLLSNNHYRIWREEAQYSRKYPMRHKYLFSNICEI